MNTGSKNYNIMHVKTDHFNRSTSVSTSNLSHSLSFHLSILAKDTIPAEVTMETSPEGLWARHVRDYG